MQSAPLTRERARVGVAVAYDGPAAADLQPGWQPVVGSLATGQPGRIRSVDEWMHVVVEWAGLDSDDEAQAVGWGPAADGSYDLLVEIDEDEYRQRVASLA